MGARSWSSSAPSVPSSHHQQHHHHHHQSSSTSSTAATTTGQEPGAGPFFSSSSSSLSSSPSSSPPSSSSPSPTGGKKHRHHHHHHHHYNHLQQQAKQQPTRTSERHAFFRIPVTGEGTKKPLDLTPQSVATAKAAVAAAAQRAERNLSVRRDLALDLPTCPTLPDGEEKPYGSSTRLRIRDHDQESEIYRECIRPPPNRTVHETSTSFPPFRCNSESILTGHLPTSDGSGRVGHSKTAGPSSSSSSTITTNNSQSSSSSSSSSIMAVYCCTSASYSSSTSSLSSNSYGSSGGGGGGYGYRNLRQPLKQQHQPLLQQQQERENGSDGKDLFSSAPPPLSGTRLLLDIHGQPIVTRSKSMSTGSSLQQQDAPCSSSSSSSSGNLLSVMVPFPPPMPQQQQQQLTIPAATSCASKTLESAVKSCVRSFRDRVHPSGKSSAPAAPAISCLVPPVGGAVGGVDNAGYVESSAGGGGGSASASGCSSRWPSATTTLPEQQQQQHNNNNNNNSHATEESSSSSSRSKLANLPVVPCASAASTSPSQTRRDL